MVDVSRVLLQAREEMAAEQWREVKHGGKNTEKPRNERNKNRKNDFSSFLVI
jgi:hypothetical protein